MDRPANPRWLRMAMFFAIVYPVVGIAFAFAASKVVALVIASLLARARGRALNHLPGSPFPEGLAELAFEDLAGAAER